MSCTRRTRSTIGGRFLTNSQTRHPRCPSCLSSTWCVHRWTIALMFHRRSSKVAKSRLYQINMPRAVNLSTPIPWTVDRRLSPTRWGVGSRIRSTLAMTISAASLKSSVSQMKAVDSFLRKLFGRRLRRICSCNRLSKIWIIKHQTRFLCWPTRETKINCQSSRKAATRAHNFDPRTKNNIWSLWRPASKKFSRVT